MSDEPRAMAPTLSLDDLRAILSDEIHKIRDGQASAASVNAISNATGKILSSVKLQMEYFRMTGQRVDIPMLAGTPSTTEPAATEPAKA